MTVPMSCCRCGRVFDSSFDWVVDERYGALCGACQIEVGVAADTIFRDIERRVDDVTELYGEYNSLHEAYSVLLEEVGELGQEIYARERNIGRIRAEAMDCAVVCARILKEWPIVREGEISAVRVGVV